MNGPFTIKIDETSGDFSSDVAQAQNGISSSTTSISATIGPGDTESVDFANDRFIIRIAVDFDTFNFASLDLAEASQTYNT